MQFQILPVQDIGNGLKTISYSHLDHSQIHHVHDFGKDSNFQPHLTFGLHSIICHPHVSNRPWPLVTTWGQSKRSEKKQPNRVSNHHVQLHSYVFGYCQHLHPLLCKQNFDAYKNYASLNRTDTTLCMFWH